MMTTVQSVSSLRFECSNERLIDFIQKSPIERSMFLNDTAVFGGTVAVTAAVVVVAAAPVSEDDP